MATYATVHELLAAWPKVHTSTLSHDEMRTMLERASNLIDSKVGGRYDVPFTLPAPPRIRDLCVDLAMMDIFYRSAEPSPFIVQRINWALEALTSIGDGTDTLVGADGSVISESSGVDVLQSNTSGYTPVFGAVPTINEGSDPDRRVAENSARGITDTPWRD